MKYSPELYAKAFLATVMAVPDAKQHKLLSRFLQVVKKNGDFPLIKKIFRKVQIAIIKKQGGKMITLETARELSKDTLAKLQNCFSKNDYVETIIRQDLLSGVRVLVDSEKELDLTLHNKLKKLFNAI